MIVNNDRSEAFVSGGSSAITGTIAMNPEMFDLIIRGIYKNPALAAVREPLFNAVDAHTEAGAKDAPVEIHVPTSLESWYSVKDHGVGMSPECVEKTFMCLGESTKRSSNELVGAKGIGSKAPLAICDMIKVTSVFNGVKSVYTVFMDKGLPKVICNRRKETKEHNGVEVRFNIPEAHLFSARRAVVHCLRYAEFPYTILNDETIVASVNEKRIAPDFIYTNEDFPGWKMEIYAGATNSYESVVVMGQQPYKSEALSAHTGYPMMVCRIPIGDCNIDPGRENTIEGVNDGGFKERLEAFIDLSVKGRIAELDKELSSYSTLREVVDVIGKKGGFFYTIKGVDWITKKMAGMLKIYHPTICCDILYGHGLRKTRGTFYDARRIVAGIPLVLRDYEVKGSGSAVSRCNYLAEVIGTSVALSDISNVEFLEGYDKDYCEGFLLMAHDLPQRPKTRSSSSSSTYQPGYVVLELCDDGYFERRRLTKAEFKNIHHYILAEGGMSRGQTMFGSIPSIPWQPDVNYIRSNIGCKEGETLWIIPEGRSDWVGSDAVNCTNALLTLLDKDRYYNKISSISRNTFFRTRSRILKIFGYKVKDFDYNMKMQSRTFRPSYEVTPGFSLDAADKYMAHYCRMMLIVYNKIVDKYPLVGMIGDSELFANEDKILQYKALVDASKDKQ